ncbi:MAG: LysR family transcriptional regulator [Alphaproteobacteria bacterium]|nr:LysR family transcriptional regulator [Alphaproteobacteria bacterium]
MDRIQTMSAFVAVAEEAGFAPAARRLGVSPPSVTRAVSELEIRLGARLFYRTTRSVRLTETGERYLADCRRILTEIEEADRHAAGIHAAPQGLVMISASALFGRIYVAPILLDLLDQYPGISFNTLFVDRIVHLIEEGVDVAVRIAELPDSSFSAIRVGSMRRVICASPEYLAAHGTPERPQELRDHETINSAHMALGGEWTLETNGKRFGVKLNSRLTVNNADTAIAGAVAGRGITRVLYYMIAQQLEAGTLKIILEDYELPAAPVHVLHKEAGHTSARTRAVVDYLAEQLRKEPVLALG